MNEAAEPEHESLVQTFQALVSELAHSRELQANGLQQLLDVLKSKPPMTDRKTAFWNAYSTLADEHDKDFQQRYSTDLDVSLIFAGLFSAVDSAFIIQIQPEIQSGSSQHIIVVAAQSLLYISLCSTLLTALLAVLGKQWILAYTSAGEHGPISTRGLERQRKFDGLRKWHFETVIQMFPLLLQFGLFVFAAGLSVYLWTVSFLWHSWSSVLQLLDSPRILPFWYPPSWPLTRRSKHPLRRL
ncbi:hypothetical protein C8R46DRAFT_980463 [Mycena filopes]|nr:hypothetical protein C8R46DRAFT_980463 [Mycena filopes]